MHEAVRSYQRVDGSCPFDLAFRTLRGVRAAARIDTVIRKLGRGLRPDVEPVGEGVQEARIHYGPGYRVDFGIAGAELIVLLICGDKRTQSADIAYARLLWGEYRTRKAATTPQLLFKPLETTDGIDP